MWITCSVTTPLPATDPHPPAAGEPRSKGSATGRTVLLRADAETPMGSIAALLMASGLAWPPGAGRHPVHGRTGLRGSAPRAPAAPAIWVDGVVIDPRRALGASPLRDGSLVRLGPPVGSEAGSEAGRRDHRGLAELRVTGGPGAGAVHQLPAGEYRIGTDPSGGVVLAHGAVPSPAFVLRVNVDRSYTITPESGADVWIDGCHHTGPEGSLRFQSTSWNRNRSVPAGPPAPRSIRLGATSLEVHAAGEPDALLRRGDSGMRLEISREPRLVRWPSEVRYRLPALPAAHSTAPLPALALLLPTVATGGMALVLQATYLLLFAALAPVSLIGSHLAAKRHSRREYRQALLDYQRVRSEVTGDAAAAIEREAAVRRAAHPDPAAVLLRATGPRRGLWERRPEDPDFLHLRVGTGDVPSRVLVEDPGAPDHRRATRWLLRDVPVTVSLPEVGVLGVVGSGDLPRTVGAWLVAQTATLHSPRDLSIQLLLNPAGASRWEWTRWLPHCQPQREPPVGPLIAADGPGRARRAAELVALTEARLRRTGQGAQSRADPAVLVLVEGAAAMRAALIPVLRSGPAVGVYVVCLERDPRLLPSECVAVIEAGSAWARLRRRGAAGVDRIRPDLVGDTERWCERLARALAPLHDPGPQKAGAAGMPERTRLLDLLGLDPPSSRELAPRWVLRRFRPSGTEFPLGVCPAGPVSLDLSRDGPHVLVAGTTGSGKSELLQSLVASLAVCNRPDEVTFVLIDYKGGSAFGDCAHLPHTVGLVTDLDSHLVSRALDSLGAELRRREVLFAASGSRDISDYHRRRGTDVDGSPSDPLPRLVVVVDEFAALARDLPDFVAGLVGLAARGRSLGIHLILATQRPAGVVSAEILANTNLRIALRVTDQAESTDVLGLPDAAFIPGSAPGRAIVRVGQEAPLLFQTARVAGTAMEDGPAPATSPGGPLVIDLPWPPSDQALTVITSSDRKAAARHQTGFGRGEAAEPRTDLRALAEVLRETARVCRVPPPRRPWLPPLPVRLTIDALPPVDDVATGVVDHHRVPPVPLGLADLCRAQAQPAFAFDLERASHLLVVGGPRSGRSTVLRTLAGAVGLIASPADVHLYGLDCGNNSLLPIADLPHTGAVVTGGETERVHRLLARLTDEVARRQALLARGGYADLTEARRTTGRSARPTGWSAQPAGRPGQPSDDPADVSLLPYLVLLLDGYEGFLASFEDLDGAVVIDRLLTLARDGPAVGLRLVVTADRRVLTGHLSSAIEQRLVLRMAERADYSLAGLAGVRIPETLPPGRGFLIGAANEHLDGAWAEVDGPVEVQMALLADDPSGAAQAGMLRRLAKLGPAKMVNPGSAAPHRTTSTTHRSRMAAGPTGARPFRLDVLPTRVSPPEVAALRAKRGGPQGTERRLSVAVGVGGDELAPVDIDLAVDGPGFVIAGPPRSGRSSTLFTIGWGLLGLRYHLVIVSPRPSPLLTLRGSPAVAIVDDLSEPDSQRVADLLPAGRRTALLVDDAELVTSTGFGESLAAFLRDNGGRERLLLAAGNTDELSCQFRGLVTEARRSRCGLLLTPQGPADGDLFGTRLPRALCGPGPPGRGLLIRRAKTTPIQVVAPPPADRPFAGDPPENR